jgi:hypothetical protein
MVTPPPWRSAGPAGQRCEAAFRRDPHGQRRVGHGQVDLVGDLGHRADYGLRHGSPCTGRDIKSVVPVLLDFVGSEALARRLVPIKDSYILEP